MEQFKALSSMDYPGRFIVMGFTQLGNPLVVYGITGRSASSQARRLVEETSERDKKISVRPTNEDLVKQGDSNLLIYDAIFIERRIIAVSNGLQTKDVYHLGLEKAHERWEFEPDAPNYTPRISGFMPANNFELELPVMGIIRRDEDGKAKRESFRVQYKTGKGLLIATYSGENKDPLPSFNREPIEVDIRGELPSDIAQTFYDSLNPNYRIAVAATYHTDTSPLVHIINRHN